MGVHGVLAVLATSLPSVWRPLVVARPPTNIAPLHTETRLQLLYEEKMSEDPESGKPMTAPTTPLIRFLSWMHILPNTKVQVRFQLYYVF